MNSINITNHKNSAYFKRNTNSIFEVKYRNTDNGFTVAIYRKPTTIGVMIINRLNHPMNAKQQGKDGEWLACGQRNK
jgi:hypothetical protein